MRDFPKVRAFRFCPLCGLKKAPTSLSCWPCTARYDIDSDPWAQRRFACTEANLTTAENFDERFPQLQHLGQNVS